ncbi:hypothetical protein NDU88_004334 [Pleurodeles waltl]|uniref:Uncharacterized protein n=1 Tax=Pleurodeles waltl TaxID=8319 RepID=A0AAV7SIG3_PLEWA|nr:hypothetical protein NDU88_004334 [Pleurodeles waltl]
MASPKTRTRGKKAPSRLYVRVPHAQKYQRPLLLRTRVAVRKRAASRLTRDARAARHVSVTGCDAGNSLSY